MKTCVVLAQGLTLNHNHSGLKIKPQLIAGFTVNHNQGILAVK